MLQILSVAMCHGGMLSGMTEIHLRFYKSIPLPNTEILVCNVDHGYLSDTSSIKC